MRACAVHGRCVHVDRRTDGRTDAEQKRRPPLRRRRLLKKQRRRLGPADALDIARARVCSDTRGNDQISNVTV